MSEWRWAWAPVEGTGMDPTVCHLFDDQGALVGAIFRRPIGKEGELAQAIVESLNGVVEESDGPSSYETCAECDEYLHCPKCEGCHLSGECGDDG